MSKNGTCRHCHQIQEMWTMPLHPQPHEKMKHIIMPEDEYTCQYLDSLGSELPPPIARRNGGFDLRPGDCDACPMYEPASVFA